MKKFVVLALVLGVASVAAASLSPKDKRFLRKIGCRVEVLNHNACRIALKDPSGPDTVKNRQLICDYPLVVEKAAE